MHTRFLDPRIPSPRLGPHLCLLFSALLGSNHLIGGGSCPSYIWTLRPNWLGKGWECIVSWTNEILVLGFFSLLIGEGSVLSKAGRRQRRSFVALPLVVERQHVWRNKTPCRTEAGCGWQHSRPIPLDQRHPLPWLDVVSWRQCGLCSCYYYFQPQLTNANTLLWFWSLLGKV